MKTPLTKDTPLGLAAGEGDLPVKLLENLQAQGQNVIVYSLDPGNYQALRTMAGHARTHVVYPGLIEKNLAILKRDQVHHLVFAGKVNKWILLRKPLLDGMALRLLAELPFRTDDAIMLRAMALFESVEVEVLPQVSFLKPLLLPAGQYSQRVPTEAERRDMEMALRLAKASAKEDIGQSAVVFEGMAIAIEAIEGTDKCIRRAREWTRGKGGVLGKVEKPDQDKRFDVPTIGPRTIKSAKAAGLTAIAFEAEKTLIIDERETIALANRWGIALVGVSL